MTENQRLRYLCRARRTDNGEWVEGFYHWTNWINPQTKEIVDVTHSILPIGCQDSYNVDPSTICQCTGLKDKDGNLIWENDIVRVIQDGSEYVYQVVWDATETDFKATNGKENYGRHFAYFSCCEEVEVIGNAFDNPEYVAKLGPTYSEYEEEDMSFLDYDEKE